MDMKNTEPFIAIESGNEMNDKAEKILRQIFRSFQGNFAICVGNSRPIMIGDAPPAFTVVFKRLKALRNLVLSADPLLHAEAYFKGWIDLNDDIYAALEMRKFIPSLKFSNVEKISLLFDALTLSDEEKLSEDRDRSWSWSKPINMIKHSKIMNRQAIGFHYDVSNDFYKLWLDDKMIYSCAYFENPDDSLEQAQNNKLDLICRKLCLKPGERLLDIGCGWGALAMWAAKHYGVKAHGVTLSEKQYSHALQKIRGAGLEKQISIELKDYRDLEGEAVFDKISSVGMFEHVGIRNLPVYFSTVHRLLKPEGLFLNHGITQDEEGGTQTVGYKFISRYVFPDGELDMISNILKAWNKASSKSMMSNRYVRTTL
jgi:cyclopropane-fatty-acyl-phospholipid synthase